MGRKYVLQSIDEIKNKYNYQIESLGYTVLDICRDENKKIKFVIEDKNGFKSLMQFNNIILGQFSPVNKFNPYSIENINLWLKLNNKLFYLFKNDSYKGNNFKLKFHCLKCNECFYSSWRDIKKGNGCGICRGMQVGKRNSLFYLYPKICVEWSKKNNISPKKVTCGTHKKIIWKCKTCNNEWIAPIYSRVQGNGCPICNISKGEFKIKNFFINNNLIEGEDFISQYKFNNCKNIFLLSFDFYLPKINICIEYQGRQHFEKMGFWGGEEKFKRTIKNDNIKQEYCKKNFIKLITISYKNFKEIDNILKDELFPLLGRR
jgi:hypothetical protein